MGGVDVKMSQKGQTKKARKSRSRSTSKSPSRKSPGRKSPSRKSPARKTPVRSSSKSRKSPARGTETPKRTRSSSRSRKVEEKVSSSSVLVKTEEIVEKHAVIVTSAGDASSTLTPANPSLLSASEGSSIRRSTRLAAKAHSADDSENKSTGDSAESKQMKGHGYEFGGPIGAFLLIFLLPATVYFINLSCSKKQCTVMKLPGEPKWRTWFNWQVYLAYGGYVLFLALLSLLPLGRQAKAATTKGAKPYTYRCNGVYSFWLCVFLMVGLWHQKYPVVPFIMTNFYTLLTAATLHSLLLSCILYLRARRAKSSALAPSASGNVVYDFFMGRELNPRVAGIDLKFFFELRPGLIGWVLVDLAFLLSTMNRNNLLQWPTNPSLVLITLGHAWYVYDAFIFEKSILSTMDISTEGFGYMLAFGDNVWVPFLYSLSARFARTYNPALPTYQIVVAVFLHLLGYTLFRGANSQKDAFRANPYDPRFANLDSISTGTNKKRLLAGGWWGLVRKPNYLGDLLMALSWSILTGCSHALPYFYPLYLSVLLLHRERRDEAACRNKHGRHWDAYCDKVRYRIIPYVY